MSFDLNRDEHGRILISHSSRGTYRACQRRYFFRYIERLRPLYVAPGDPRNFGKSAHAGAEALRESRNADDAIVEYWGDVSKHEHFEQRERARALMRGYRARWFGDPSQADHRMRVEVIEGKFTGDIVDPITGWVSNEYAAIGVIDAAVRVLEPCRWGTHEIEAGLYLYELKTWSRIEAARISQLALNSQIHLYSHHLEEALGEPVRGVLYDIAERCKLAHQEAETPAEFKIRRDDAHERAMRGELRGRIRQRKEETDEEFLRRSIETGLAAVAEMSPTERETDEGFAARLDEHYEDPDRFHRVALVLRKDQIEAARADLFEHTQEHHTKFERWKLRVLQEGEENARAVWAKNDAACFDFHRACDYWGICLSVDSPIVINENFRVEPPDEPEDSLPNQEEF